MRELRYIRQGKKWEWDVGVVSQTLLRGWKDVLVIDPEDWTPSIYIQNKLGVPQTPVTPASMTMTPFSSLECTHTYMSSHACMHAQIK